MYRLDKQYKYCHYSAGINYFEEITLKDKQEIQASKIVKIYLVCAGERHEWLINTEKSCYENDINEVCALTNNGETQIKKLGEYFISNRVAIDTILTSEAYCAKQSALILGQCTCKSLLNFVITDDLMILNEKECETLLVSPSLSCNTALNRVNTWFNNVISDLQNGGKTLLCVSHNTPIRAIVENFQVNMQMLEVTDASFSFLTHNQETGETKLGITNCTDHLQS